MSQPSQRDRVVGADALLRLLSDPTHLTVLGCIASRGQPVSRDDVAHAAELAGIDVAPLTKSLLILSSVGLVRDDNGFMTVQYDTFGRVRDRLVSRDPVLRALRRHPKMKGCVKDGIIDRVPSAVAMRRPFAEFLMDCLPEMGQLSEPELNAYLSRVCVPYVEARRLLVDEGLLERDTSGRRYWVSGSDDLRAVHE